MKKNKMMRVASVLLVAVLLSTCAISGTFAKYTTSDTATDTARVAKWGVTVSATGDDAFATKYDDNASESGTKVVSTTDVVAPGTKGTLASISINGTPEVMVDVTVTANLTLTGWEIDGGEYCPIVFKVGEEEIKMEGTTITTIADLESAVEAKFTEMSQTNVSVGTDLAANISISWEWPYAGEDTKDTALGDLTTAPTITFDCRVTVTQVD